MTDPLVPPPKDVIDRATEAVRDRCRWSTSYVRRRRAVIVLSWLSDQVWRAMYEPDEEKVVLDDQWSLGNAIRVSSETTIVEMRGQEPISLPTMQFGRLLQSLSYSWSDKLSETEAAPEATTDEMRQFILRWNNREQIIRTANTKWRPLWLLRSRLVRIRSAIYGGPHFYWDESLDPDYGDGARETDPYVIVIDGEHAAWRLQGEERTVTTEKFLEEMESLFCYWARLAELPAHPAGARVLSASCEPVQGHLFADGVFVTSEKYASDRLRLLAQRALPTALSDALKRPAKKTPTALRTRRVAELTNGDPQLSLLAEDLRAFGGVDDQLWTVVRDCSPTWNKSVECWVIRWQTAEGDDLVLPVAYDSGDYRDAELPPIEPINLIVEAFGQNGWACSDAATALLTLAASNGRQRLELTLFPVSFEPSDDEDD